ncbi:MAG: hypothetical protein H6707_21580 [Deltaproteobacteria bacterium]|nr:hypothetical protein [Deltaproteobacteria bacterium]
MLKNCRRLRLTLGLAIFALWIAACGSSDKSSATCTEACQIIYGSCGLTLLDANSKPLPESYCRNECSKETPADQTSALSCIQGANCDASTLGSCIGI